MRVIEYTNSDFDRFPFVVRMTDKGQFQVYNQWKDNVLCYCDTIQAAHIINLVMNQNFDERDKPQPDDYEPDEFEDVDSWAARQDDEYIKRMWG